MRVSAERWMLIEGVLRFDCGPSRFMGFNPWSPTGGAVLVVGSGWRKRVTWEMGLENDSLVLLLARFSTA